MKTQVYIVTGFLGAGKTTLVKRILSFSADLSKTIVLVNEFGKIGIDKALIKETAAMDIVELSSGCICCSLRPDMIRTLNILRQEYAPERIVIEASGVADPLAVIEALGDRMLLPYFCLNKTVTVMDADFWEAREAFGEVFKSQVAQADIILLNKIDTLHAPRIPEILKQICLEAKNARIIPTLHCNIDSDIFWSGLDPQEKAGRGTLPVFNPYDPGRDIYSLDSKNRSMAAKEAGFITFSFETTKEMDEALFMHFLDTTPLELFRIKGPVRFAGKTRMLNFVGGKKQWQKWPDTASTCLAFVGWDMIEERILKKLNTCLMQA